MLFGKYVNRFYLKYAWLFLIGIAALVVIDYSQLYLPEFLGQIVDLFDAGSIQGHEEEVKQIILSVVIVAAIMFVGRFLFRITIFTASDKIQASLRDEMYQKAQRLSASYFHSNSIGNILSWFTSDIETIGDIFGWGTVQLVDALFLSIIAIAKMIGLDWFLSLICALPIALIILWGALVEKYMTDMWTNRQKATDELYDFSQENFTGIRVIKAFVKENQQLHAFSKVAKKNYDVNYRFAKIETLFHVSIETIIALITTTILGFGSWIVYQSVIGSPINVFGVTINLTAGQLVTFAGYFSTLIWPMIALGQIFTMRSRGKASLKRITAYLDSPEDIKDCENPIILENIKGNIEFKNLSFTYPEAKEATLKNINIKINEGETIGIVGKIGCGKTTLVNLILRTYNVDENSIFIDGNDMMKCQLKSLRRCIAYVPQDNFLFSDRISENIAFDDADKVMDKVKEAAKFAAVDDNIEEFKDGYNTISGEYGVTLSGGQKQRISIARAYIKEAPIMILDDSVSAVDVKTEETILHNIKTQRAGKTTIVIASRVSTVSHLDKILVLNNGEVEAFDSHENLMKVSPTYQKMVYLQELEREVEGGK